MRRAVVYESVCGEKENEFQAGDRKSGAKPPRKRALAHMLGERETKRLKEYSFTTGIVGEKNQPKILRNPSNLDLRA